MNSIAETFKAPYVERDEITITKSHGYYDGPTCGLLEWNGLPYYFNWVDDSQDEPYDRVYAIYQMTSEQVAFYTAMDDWWDLCSAIYPDWSDFEKMFYTKYPVEKWPKFAPNQLVAWFTG